MVAAAWLRGLKELTKRPPTDKDLDIILAEIKSDEHARGPALVAATAVEEALRNFLKSRMVKLGNTEKEALFERDAPLSTFSKLIRVAHAFGFIDTEFRQECDRVREIRNTFAHSPGGLSFETPEIETACLMFPKFYGVFLEFIDPDHPKALYIGAVTKMTVVLNEARNNPKAELPLSLTD